MARPKVNATKSERYAKYRKRAADNRNDLNKYGLQAQGLDDPAPPPEGIQWFKVSVTINRPDLSQSATLIYILTEQELLRFQHDLRIFRIKQSDSPQYGTYAFANSGECVTGVPGMMTIAFDGLTITATNLEAEFQPPNSYSISEGAVRLLLSQRKRSNATVFDDNDRFA